MKKLLTILIFLFLTFHSYAEERVYLTCEIYMDYEHNELDEPQTLIIFPNINKYIYGEDTGLYTEEEDSITWKKPLSSSISQIFTLNRISGDMIKFGVSNIDSNPVVTIIFGSKCTRIEALF